MKIRYGPSGVHLFNRHTGLNVLIDEFIPPQNLWAPAPRQVSIALTNACDLACTYCFAPKTSATLRFDRILGWLKELDANGTIGVGFGGGEPTLYPHFVELCKAASSNTNLAITFTTHGHHLDDAILTALKGHVHFIRVSMDGVHDTYENLRQRSFRALEHRLEAVREISTFGINYVVNSDTICDLEKAANVVDKAGAAELLLLPEEPARGRAGIDHSTMEHLRRWIARYSFPMRLAVSERAADGLPTCDPFLAESTIQAYAHIDANGILKSSSYAKTGVPIDDNEGVIGALQKLKPEIKTSQRYEDLD